MRLSWIKTEMTNDKCPYKRREGDVKAKAETGVLHPQAKECQGLPTCTRSQQKGTAWILSSSL